MLPGRQGVTDLSWVSMFKTRFKQIRWRKKGLKTLRDGRGQKLILSLWTQQKPGPGSWVVAAFDSGQQTPLRNDLPSPPPPPRNTLNLQPRASSSVSLYLPTGHRQCGSQCNVTPHLLGASLNVVWGAVWSSSSDWTSGYKATGNTINKNHNGHLYKWTAWTNNNHSFALFEIV
jgi:hypothetical protein